MWPREPVAAVHPLATLSVAQRLQAYAELSKVGIVLLVLVSTGSGFMLAVPLAGEFPWIQGLAVLLGVMLLSSGASALNQVQERERDARMARTAGRPLPSGRLAPAEGLGFAGLGILAGTLVLWWAVGETAGLLGLLAAAYYNGVYTPWLKPGFPYAAVPGAVPGAIPPVIGWVAGGGAPTDAGALILFGILFLWQLPHFWALALRYRTDYAAGGFPMVSDAVGVPGTARLILVYAFGLTGLALAAPTFGVGAPPPCWGGGSSGSRSRLPAGPRIRGAGSRSSSSRISSCSCSSPSWWESAWSGTRCREDGAPGVVSQFDPGRPARP
jgi:heme o synthase